MSIFTGRQHPGAMRDHRAVKRQKAEARNAVTPEHRKSQKARARRITVKEA